MSIMVVCLFVLRFYGPTVIVSSIDGYPYDMLVLSFHNIHYVCYVSGYLCVICGSSLHMSNVFVSFITVSVLFIFP